VLLRFIYGEVFAADALPIIQNKGGMTRRKMGDDFRQKILSIAISKELMQAMFEFQRAATSTQALLKTPVV